MRRWDTKHFILSGILAALTFALAFLLGVSIIAATGIPATGGIANIFAAIFVITIGMKLVPRFGFATLTIGLVFTFMIPTILGGPPGVYKPLNGILVGLVMDVVAALGRRTWAAHIVAGSLGAMTSIVSIYGALVLFGFPGADRLQPLLLPLTGMQAVMGALGALAALFVFEKRLKNLETVQRIMADSGPPRGE